MEDTKSNGGSSPPLKFATRSKSGFNTYFGPPDIKKDSKFEGAASTNLSFSEDGSLLFVVDVSTGISIYDAATGKQLQKIPQTQVSYASLSPKGSYLLTWQRITPEVPQDNLIVWDVSTGNKLEAFVQKNLTPDHWPSIKWSSDDSVSGRMVTNEVQFFTGKDIGKIAWRLKLPDIHQFAISLGEAPLKIAAFVPEKKGAPGYVRLFKYPSMEMICSKSFYKAQDVNLIWNPTGTALLAQTHTDVDKSGKSYYGESGLHFLSADGKLECTVPLKKEGQVHDVAWSPNGQFFAVTYGYMPAQTTVYNGKCEPIADLGAAARNTIKWSPNSRLICSAGFGNLAGEFDIWDHKKLKKIGSGIAEYSCHIEWAPDSRHLLTGVLFPRMRVDNGYKIWAYDGKKLYQEAVEELYQIHWKPEPLTAFPNRPPSPRLYSAAKVDAPAPTKPAKYVHPNAVGRTVAPLKREEDGPTKYKKEQTNKDVGPPGYVSTSSSKNAKRNQKRKQKKQQDDKDSKDEEEGEQTVVTEQKQEKEQVQEPPKSQETEVEIQKKIKVVQKKLRQIEEIKEKQASGKPLDPAQKEKLQSEKALIAELNTLQKK